MNWVMKDIVVPFVLMLLSVLVVIGLPTYFVYKYECKTFAELQQTEFKYTINGSCYIKSPSGEWITKDMWYFDKALSGAK